MRNPAPVRKCGVCAHRNSRVSDAPSAACVVAFARKNMDGADGVLAHIVALAATKVMPRASSYCMTCRACTWLCDENKELCAAAVDFWHEWRANERMSQSMAAMTHLLRAKKGGSQRKRSSGKVEHGPDEAQETSGGPAGIQA
jgi:Fe-S-cluster-containing dehydrogenase component